LPTDGDAPGHVCDLLIIGSGGGAITAALVAKDAGLAPLIIEKQAKVGGSTGYSGGVLWVPNNPLLGVKDSYERARQYLDAAVPYQGPGTSPARREAFLKSGPDMIRYLRGKGMKFKWAKGWPDYYDELPGGEPLGRSLVVPLFDVNRLGPWARLLSRRPGRSLPIGSEEGMDLFLMKRTWRGRSMAMRLGWRMFYQRMTGKKLVATGAALQGRLLEIALRENISLWPDTPVNKLITEDGRVTGAVAIRNGRPVRVQARRGVLLNVGGFSHNAEMRRQYQPAPASTRWTSANPGDTGELIAEAMRLGAATDCMDEAWWLLTSLGPDEAAPHGTVLRDGTKTPFLHHLDLSLPYSILVDRTGHRFADEAGAYMEIGQRLYAREQATGKALPSYVIMDRRHRDYYIWGASAPGRTPRQWQESGYMKRAETIEDLARQCEIDPSALAATIDRFNGFCRTGVDEDFGRGGRAFDRSHGDPNVKPNPNLGQIEQAPFYAFAMYPGDVGTAGGLVTDADGRVLRDDGAVIEGLYATGNCTASVVGRTYPAAGASIAASFVFGYLAARHMSR
jgi:3-oxosteroid 1-dehydrogenase